MLFPASINSPSWRKATVSTRSARAPSPLPTGAGRPAESAFQMLDGAVGGIRTRDRRVEGPESWPLDDDSCVSMKHLLVARMRRSEIQGYLCPDRSASSAQAPPPRANSTRKPPAIAKSFSKCRS